MRFLSPLRRKCFRTLPFFRASHWISLAAIFIASFHMTGCVGGTTGGTSSPPPPVIQVSVVPPSGSVILGNSLAFTGTVKGTNDTLVTWSVNGVEGGNSTYGTINENGLYTAPVDLPMQASIQITATSHADSTKSAKVTVTIISDINVDLTTGTSSVELGAVKQFGATVTSSGHPDTGVQWSVSGTGCGNSCGSVDASGNYTAPQILPSPASVALTAKSIADNSKQASTTISITSNFSLQISAPGIVTTGAASTLVATITPAPGSNPSGALTWSLNGPGCSGSSCGILSAVTTQISNAAATPGSETYTAPLIAPTPNTVTIAVIPQADPSKAAHATIAIQPGAGVSILPLTATLAANHRVTLTAQVTGVANAAVNWNVNGVAGGNATVGQVCTVGSSPCQPVVSGNILQVDYVAPGAIPSANPVMVTAASVADSTRSASAQITVINHVLVSVNPGSVTLAPLATQAFTASVLGAANQNVVWQVQGTPCTGGNVCGTINANGTYTAPPTTPSPNTLQVLAISSDDTAQYGTANVTISAGASILTLHPASVYAGAANGFTLRVNGSGFTATSPGAGSVLLIDGTARTTNCTSALECIAPVTAADVAAAGAVSVQIQNPGGKFSNAVNLVVVAPSSEDESIALTASFPAVTGKDIIVVEPTTAGVSVPGNDVDLNVAALGAFSAPNNSCTLGGNPIALTRPANGSTTADICIFSSSGLDSSMTFSVSGPGDISVIAKQPAGLGIIRLTLQIAANAQTGARTLFIQNSNLDKTAASGSLEVN